MKANKHDFDIEDICLRIIDGESFRDIAKEYNAPLGSFHWFISKKEFKEKIDMALEFSAQTFDDMAEQILLDAKSTMPEMQRGRELAQHYRWRAAKRNPRRFSDKIDMSHTVHIEQPLFPMLNQGTNAINIDHLNP